LSPIAPPLCSSPPTIFFTVNAELPPGAGRNEEECSLPGVLDEVPRGELLEALDSPEVPGMPRRFRVGTLSYTLAGVFVLFFWLLWGDFCFTVMEAVIPAVLPLKLNSLGAPNWLLGLIVTTIPSCMTIVLNPVASFWSDRHRGPWGRRIPFLFTATPFIVLFLALLGFSEPIGRFLHRSVLAGLPQTTVILLVIGVLMICFQFFNMFVGSVYFYLFNDVVPKAYLGRFMALFRAVSTLAGAGYSYFAFEYSVSHMQTVFLGAGLMYLIAFTLMCWRVKEGEYPPPPPHVDGGTGLLSSIRTYGRECFSHRLYWYFFLANSFYAMTWAVIPYQALQARSIGISLGDYGRILGLSSFGGAILLIPAGVLVDRIHPLRVMIGGIVLMLLALPPWLIFIFFNVSPQHAMAIYICIVGVTIPITVLYTASEFPMYMRLLDKERYGQFCSANAMLRSFFIIGSGVVSGAFLDFISRYTPNKDYAYRFVPCWLIFCFVGCLIFLLLLHREWQRRGGSKSYTPP